jgi:NAD(P)-dependent dehydrogenase (short-subunit alcohol dehydrogenase family)
MIVTGGSRGIGAATVRLAARHGYAVCFSYLDSPDAAETLAAQAEATGGSVLPVRADMASEAGVLTLFEACDRHFGAPGALVANAGITGPLRRVADLDADTLHRVFDLNVIGCLLAAREAVRRMSTALGGRGGAIVNVSSRAAQLGGSGDWVHYAASKGAVDTLTIGLAREVGSEGIRVNAVRPGLIDTELHAAAGAPDRIDRMLGGVPMGRAGTADEVAESIVWLAGPQAAYVSGSLVDVGGGR